MSRCTRHTLAPILCKMRGDGPEQVQPVCWVSKGSPGESAACHRIGLRLFSMRMNKAAGVINAIATLMYGKYHGRLAMPEPLYNTFVIRISRHVVCDLWLSEGRSALYTANVFLRRGAAEENSLSRSSKGRCYRRWSSSGAELYCQLVAIVHVTDGVVSL